MSIHASMRRCDFGVLQGLRILGAALVMAFGVLLPARAAIQFDVWPGFEGKVRGGDWFPVGVEVLNDGPPIEGVIEFSPSQFSGQIIRYDIELPTGTRKRFTLPMFCSSGSMMMFDARLLDKAGKVRADRLQNRPEVAGWESVMLGALPENFGGIPSFPKLETGRNDLHPSVQRLMPEFLPDNPICLSALNSIYLSSARAVSMKEPEKEALLSWLHSGGHLIVSIDQPGDLNTAGWLNAMLPASVTSGTNLVQKGELQRWLVKDDEVHPGRDGPLRFGFEPPVVRQGASNPYASQPSDPAFDKASMSIVNLRPLPAAVSFGPTATPLIVSGSRGRGLVTVLAFNPEKEPFKGWKNRPWFWARLAGVPARALGKEGSSVYGGRPLDSVFGAMVDTRQIRKLPVTALLLLLLVYLAVIGPIDHWWLKKINRPMLTWITFPAYVALFSMLIYWIGFRLRAGQTEWNELQVVDILPRRGDAILRGRSYGMVYSPANQTYGMAADTAFSAMRGEFRGLWGGSLNDPKSTVELGPRPGFKSKMYVPVWTSQMAVHDWQQESEAPLTANFKMVGREWKANVENHSGKPIANAWLVHDGSIHELGGFKAGEKREIDRHVNQGQSLSGYLRGFESSFQLAASQRDQVLGGNENNHIDDWAGGSVAASFVGLLESGNADQRDYIFSQGSDLSPLLSRGDAVLMAWIPDDSISPPMNRFASLRSRRGSLLRLVVPVGK